MYIYIYTPGNQGQGFKEKQSSPLGGAGGLGTFWDPKIKEK
jgi:hypothetical protein